MLSVVCEECHQYALYGDCHYAELNVIMLNVIMLSVMEPKNKLGCSPWQDFSGESNIWPSSFRGLPAELSIVSYATQVGLSLTHNYFKVK